MSVQTRLLTLWSYLPPTLRSVVPLAKWSVAAGCVAHTTATWVVCPWMLQEESMEPTFKAGQVGRSIIFSQLSGTASKSAVAELESPSFQTVLAVPWPTCGELNRGDIVIVRDPNGPKRRLCKRVIGKTTHGTQILLFRRLNTDT